MALASLVTDLKASLHDSAKVFTSPGDADFERFLQQALPDMQFKRPLSRLATVTLLTDQTRYAMPVSDFAAYKVSEWADPRRAPKPWEPGYPGPVPRISTEWDGAAWWVVMDPAPTAALLACYGSSLRFWYFARHVLGAADGDTTVNVLDRGLLLLRAQVEALKEMAIRNVTKPVQMRDGLSGTPRNSTPSALAEQLLTEFREAR
ncbi:MAG: hypothetical protein JNK17_02095 [Hydrogenophaga sp.]|nr:hypothetical protein [Hydrogenophaga sp.]